jgi:hypothetical protein
MTKYAKFRFNYKIHFSFGLSLPHRHLTPRETEHSLGNADSKKWVFLLAGYIKLVPGTLLLLAA